MSAQSVGVVIDSEHSVEKIEDEIRRLQSRLDAAKKLRASSLSQNGNSTAPPQSLTIRAPIKSGKSPYQASIVDCLLIKLIDLIATSKSTASHFLLLLSDSALPLGSFAFSSGLESYLAHTPKGQAAFSSFLPVSVSSYASTTLPFVLAAHRQPSAQSVAELDDALDAAIICTVGRRASVAQGRALLGIWERSFTNSLPSGSAAAGALKDYSAMLKSSSSSSSSSASSVLPQVSAHLAPLFGAICQLVGLTAYQTAYIFMLSHIKALVSAAVRASMFGPYQAQRLLASEGVQSLITAVVEREWETRVEDAGQSVPVMDLWIGRHEMLYSRIFNS